MCFTGNPDNLVPTMTNIISKNQGFWVVVTGDSMYPTLRNILDRVYIEPLYRKVKKGDILLTKSYGGRCLLHRVIKTEKDDIYYRGDALPHPDKPLKARNVIGIVTKIDRKGKVISAGNITFIIKNFIYRKYIVLRHSIYAFIKNKE